MPTYKLAKAEKLIQEIKDIARYKSYIFVEDDKERLTMILEEIIDYEREEK